MSDSDITITIKLFAVYQEVCGRDELILQVAPNTQVSWVLERLLETYPELQMWRELTRFGINFTVVEPTTVLQSGDEVVLIPPVSGGSVSD